MNVHEWIDKIAKMGPVHGSLFVFGAVLVLVMVLITLRWVGTAISDVSFLIYEMIEDHKEAKARRVLEARENVLR